MSRIGGGVTRVRLHPDLDSSARCGFVCTRSATAPRAPALTRLQESSYIVGQSVSPGAALALWSDLLADEPGGHHAAISQCEVQPVVAGPDIDDVSGRHPTDAGQGPDVERIAMQLEAIAERDDGYVERPRTHQQCVERIVDQRVETADWQEVGGQSEHCDEWKAEAKHQWRQPHSLRFQMRHLSATEEPASAGGRRHPHGITVRSAGSTGRTKSPARRWRAHQTGVPHAAERHAVGGPRSSSRPLGREREVSGATFAVAGAAEPLTSGRLACRPNRSDVPDLDRCYRPDGARQRLLGYSISGPPASASSANTLISWSASSEICSASITAPNVSAAAKWGYFSRRNRRR